MSNIETFFNSEDAQRLFFPGRIFLGKGISGMVAELVAKHQSVVIIVDEVFAESPLHRSVASAVENGRATSWIVAGPPFAQDVLELADQLKELPSVVVSIGGGSASDFAKSLILHHLFGTIDGVGIDKKRGMVPRLGANRPVYIAVPTTAGSGAEASRYYVTYDKSTHAKVFGKSWTLVADWIFLDPELLATTPPPLLVACAFDAFVHFFETLIARHERSPFGEMLSLDGIPRIMGALNEVIAGKRRDNDIHEQLLYGATLSGVAISNVRTGHIHEAAGALLELVDLSHPETLFVFFRDAAEQYLDVIGDREQLLVSRLRLNPAFAAFSSLSDVISWWETVFAEVGLDRKIRGAMTSIQFPLEKVRRHVFERVYSDKVWINKECPVRLDEQSIVDLIDKALERFGAVGA